MALGLLLVLLLLTLLLVLLGLGLLLLLFLFLLMALGLLLCLFLLALFLALRLLLLCRLCVLFLFLRLGLFLLCSRLSLFLMLCWLGALFMALVLREGRKSDSDKKQQHSNDYWLHNGFPPKANARWYSLFPASTNRSARNDSDTYIRALPFGRRPYVVPCSECPPPVRRSYPMFF